MSLKINEIEYFSTNEVLDKLQVTRQTLWRWRQQGKVPSGYQYRGKWILFTAAEVEEISCFANRLEPIAPTGPLKTRSFSEA